MAYPQVQWYSAWQWLLGCSGVYTSNSLTKAPSKERPLTPTTCSLGANPTLHPLLPSSLTINAASSLGAVIHSHNNTPQPCPALPNNRTLPKPKQCTRHVHQLLVATIPAIGTRLSGGGREGKSVTCCPKNYTMYVSPPKILRQCVVSLMAKCHNFGTKTNCREPNIWAYLSWNG